MSRVIVDVTVSLDGFMAGPDIDEANPMGRGGLSLHEWIFKSADNDVDLKIVRERSESTGSVVMGRRTFDFGIDVWQDTPWPVDCFVLTHHPLPRRSAKSGSFTFVADPVEALDRAVDAAAGQDVRLMGGQISRRMLELGRVDEVQLQVAPVLLGDGLPLFERTATGPRELEPIAVIPSPHATHLHYRVRR